jgi:hypothetical protein
MENLDRIVKIKNQVLDEVDKSKKAMKLRAAAMGLVEGSLLITYLCLMNYHERLHWLILVAALLTYGTISMGLLTLMAYIDVNTQRVLKAIALDE